MVGSHRKKSTVYIVCPWYVLTLQTSQFVKGKDFSNLVPGSFASVRMLFSLVDGSKIPPPFAKKTFGFYELRVFSNNNHVL